jgi:hypothetical protein
MLCVRVKWFQCGLKIKSTTCPYGVPLAEIARVHDLVCFLSDLFKGLEHKIVILEGEAKKLSKKLISLKYNMDDCKVVATEAQKGFDLVKSRL